MWPAAGMKTAMTKHPYKGETKPMKEDPKYRPGGGKYSWFKAPRYEGDPMRSRAAGPCPGGLRQGPQGYQTARGQRPEKLGVPVGSPVLHPWAEPLPAALKPSPSVTDGNVDGSSWVTSKAATPRPTRTLGNSRQRHGRRAQRCPAWCSGPLDRQVEGKKIANYQYVVPSTWNLRSRETPRVN
jgi:[NiFe] hydrogenase large subunit